jgi:hypothetical protein
MPERVTFIGINHEVDFREKHEGNKIGGEPERRRGDGTTETNRLELAGSHGDSSSALSGLFRLLRRT